MTVTEMRGEQIKTQIYRIKIKPSKILKLVLSQGQVDETTQEHQNWIKWE